ncbi:helix-turn-helix transcriptional regulator [bacterium]|nr:helix-turn-helix transcriptional regulator [bacterium]
MNKRQLYNRIKLLRQERGMSRQELADLIEVNVQTVGYLERFEYSPSLDLAFRICDVFDLPVEMVFAKYPMQPMSVELLKHLNERGGYHGKSE